jgi:hypothetical protein
MALPGARMTHSRDQLTHTSLHLDACWNQTDLTDPPGRRLPDAFRVHWQSVSVQEVPAYGKAKRKLSRSTYDGESHHAMKRERCCRADQIMAIFVSTPFCCMNTSAAKSKCLSRKAT